ncbi:hypothetical protein SteCoe_28465 [Stentor coeruleus]|uniref:Uncharacterized protein n=1 Tax=Stentor coeruleus TaxID=5963 RepID=A0A1R2B844_9CILI|nr:hypothetical protein SteCoe_28465 [Stentor coeruleus]
MEFKIVFLGPQSSGKSAFLLRAIADNYHENYFSTCGASYMGKIIIIDENQYKLNFWDIGGDERLVQLSVMYTRDADAILLFYDTSNDLGFDKIPELVTFYKNTIPSDSCLFIIGAKVDCGNNTPAIGKAVRFCNENGIKHFLTSSKTRENVDSIVQEITKKCIG